MNTLYRLLLIACTAAPWQMSAQFDQFVIGSLGGEIQSATGISFIHSIGDVAGTFVHGNSVSFSQGFVQCFHCTSCVTITSIEAVEKGLEWKIYPNPTDDRITVETNSTAILRYRLFNAQGMLLAEQTLQGNQIDLQAHTAGVYFLVFTDEKGRPLANAKVLKR